MSIDDSLLQKFRQLPPEKQKEVIDFVDFLQKKTEAASPPRRSLAGLWAGLGFDVTEEDIAEVRSEYCRDFPREDI